ncbi:hypothetical protein GOBAR_AA21765 [Gossypium barbadense]|uniref:Uncharacterized protein n=1 Tax=Gossypium barbadense TaxID=3634 RepID=A0A2P5X6C8_GOSBA|nr:hypothetical protein GOBAR_AA21765 [Gossypium barbadense]
MACEDHMRIRQNSWISNDDIKDPPTLKMYISLNSSTAMSHSRGYLSHHVLGKKFLPCFHTAVSQSRVTSLNNRRESGGGYSGGRRGWVPQMLRQKNIISQVGYGHGRAGHGSRGEPFPVEFLVPM